jgi:hypothetical protein
VAESGMLSAIRTRETAAKVKLQRVIATSLLACRNAS